MASMNGQELEKALVPGVSPQVYSKADFQEIAALVHTRAGIVLSEGKKMLAYSRIAPLLRKSGCATFREFLDQVRSDQELATLTVSSLTTNHTYFNREAHHFEHFNKTVRPKLLAQAQAGEPVRLWSAGCSSGEEIWNLMMVLLGEDKSEGKRLASSDLLALASDLAEHAVTAGKTACYATDALKEIPQSLRGNWCREAQDQTEIGDELRALVRFRQLNLLGEWPFRNRFDVIFCRNVMIYFDHDTKERLVGRLVEQLHPGGYLYIGHSERVSGQTVNLLEPVGPTIYRKKP